MPHLARCQAAIEDALWKRIEPPRRRAGRASGRAARRTKRTGGNGSDGLLGAGQAASLVVPTVRAAIQASSAERG